MNYIEIELAERKSDWAMSSLQSHNYYELYFLLSGNRRVFYENKMFSVDENTFCIIPPFHMHKTEGGACKRVIINVSPNLLTANEKSFLESCQNSVAFKLNPTKLNIITELLEQGASVKLNDIHSKNQLMLSYMHVILDQMQQDLLIPLDFNAITNTSKKDTLVLNIVYYLNENFTKKITLEDLCNKFYISANTLCSRFQSSMHCSVMQYLSFVRISTAKKLLSTTNKTIEEIAEQCGYSSANYFSLIFKKEVGLSPLNYRKSRL